MLGEDPPRKPPRRNPLARSKSCNGPTRRKRGREVLEDITWIVNDPSSWLDGAAARSAVDARDDASLARHLEAADGVSAESLTIPGPSNTSFILASASDAAPARAINMSRARSDSALPSVETNDASIITGNNRLQTNGFIHAPIPSVSRITNLDTSSPPSSPHSSSRYGFFGGASTSSGLSNVRSAGLSRAATMPFLVPGPSLSAGATQTISRPASRPTSPSIRAPPPLRRSNSSSSISSMDANTSTSSLLTTPSPSSSPLPSIQSDPFSASRVLAGARTMPAYASAAPNVPAQEDSPAQLTRILPVPTIQREMPSPERKRTRHGPMLATSTEDDEDTED